MLNGALVFTYEEFPPLHSKTKITKTGHQMHILTQLGARYLQLLTLTTLITKIIPH